MAASIRLAADVRVLVLVPEVESEVVDHVADVLDNIGPLVQVALGSAAAEVLKGGHVVLVGRGGEAGEDALVGEEVRAGADGEEGALADWVALLQLDKGRDEAQGLGVLLDDLVGVAAEDDEDVVVLQLLVGLLVGDLAGEGDVLAGEDGLLGAGDGAVEGLGLYSKDSRSALGARVTTIRGRGETAETAYLGHWSHGGRR